MKQAVKRYEHSSRKWTRISSAFPTRSVTSCRKRWQYWQFQLWKKRMNSPEPHGNSSELETSEGNEEPYSKLTGGTSSSQLAHESIILIDPTTQVYQLTEILRKVSSCNYLRVILPIAPTNPTWIKLYQRVLERMEESVKGFECHTVKQDLVSPFIGRCRNLTTLKIRYLDTYKNWEWEKQPSNASIKDLTFSESSMYRENLAGAFIRFPRMEKLTQANKWPPRWSMRESAPPAILRSSLAPVRVMESPHLMPPRFLQQLQELTLTVSLISCFRNVVTTLPQLVKLRKLCLKMTPYLIHSSSEISQNISWLELCAAITRCPNLSSLTILSLLEADNLLQDVFDYAAIEQLSNLPKSVQQIQYKELTLRM